MLAFYLSTLDEKIDKMDFEQIYLKFHDDVLKRIQNILKNEEDIKDVVQLTWLTVLKNMSLFQNKDEQSIKAYIIAIARNQSISIIRKRRKEADLFYQIESETAEQISDEDFFDTPCPTGERSRWIRQRAHKRACCWTAVLSMISDRLQRRISRRFRNRVSS